MFILPITRSPGEHGEEDHTAGMIARAGGDQARKRELLARALALSPAFDPVHAPLARKALEE